MENPIPYYGNLHMDAGTKKLILNLLGSIRSVVPVANPPGPVSPESESDLKDLGQIRKILLLARQHSDQLEGLFNPDELLRYERYVRDYEDIMEHLEKTLEEIKLCRDSALKFASGMAEMVEDHLEMTSGSGEGPGLESHHESLHIDNEGIRLKVV
jgi:hypothetical protein